MEVRAATLVAAFASGLWSSSSVDTNQPWKAELPLPDPAPDSTIYSESPSSILCSVYLRAAFSLYFIRWFTIELRMSCAAAVSNLLP